MQTWLQKKEKRREKRKRKKKKEKKKEERKEFMNKHFKCFRSQPGNLIRFFVLQGQKQDKLKQIQLKHLRSNRKSAYGKY